MNVYLSCNTCYRYVTSSLDWYFTRKISIMKVKSIGFILWVQYPRVYFNSVYLFSIRHITNAWCEVLPVYDNLCIVFLTTEYMCLFTSYFVNCNVQLVDLGLCLLWLQSISISVFFDIRSNFDIQAGIFCIQIEHYAVPTTFDCCVICC